jgi:hypothetical protein
MKDSGGKSGIREEKRAFATEIQSILDVGLKT